VEGLNTAAKEKVLKTNRKKQLNEVSSEDTSDWKQI
jgi:hypothetical protein